MVFCLIHRWRILLLMTRKSSPEAAIFGIIFRTLRTQRGWTIRKCAQRLGITPTHLGVLEAGGNMPSLELLLEVADTFNTEASALVRMFEQARKAGREAEASASAILPAR
jgi:transcriptional regulator with XRE-family HTH domain